MLVIVDGRELKCGAAPSGITPVPSYMKISNSFKRISVPDRRTDMGVVISMN
jgi:hypothetical protein